MIDPRHVGQPADLLVWVEDTLPPNPTAYYFTLDERMKAILAWDQVPAQLAAFIPKVTLKTVESVPVYRGQLIYMGTIKVVFGYRLSDNTVVFNAQPLEITNNPDCKKAQRTYASNPIPRRSMVKSENLVARCVSCL